MNFVNRFWRFFRLGLLIIAFIACGFYLFITTPWYKYFGHPPDYAELIREGQPIVTAVYRFKADRGIWPEYLDDLKGGYLSDSEYRNFEREWDYELMGDGRPGLSHKTDERRKWVGFDFDPDQPQWFVFGPGESRKLKAVGKNAGVPASTLPAEKVVANRLEEMDRRIGRAPTMMQYRRDKAALLRKLGRDGEAREVVEEALRADVFHWWPRLARVAMDLDRQGAATASTAASRPREPVTPQSLAEFDQWVHANPTFTHFYYLSVAWRLAGIDAGALDAIEEAAKLPAQLGDHDNEVPAFYLWDMARFALRHEKWDLVIQLANTWETLQSDRKYRYKEYSYLPLRAAARLAKGDAGGAQSDLDQLAENRTRMWARNLDPLEAAVKRSDRTFRYDPGNSPPMLEVFPIRE